MWKSISLFILFVLYSDIIVIITSFFIQLEFSTTQLKDTCLRPLIWKDLYLIIYLDILASSCDSKWHLILLLSQLHLSVFKVEFIHISFLNKLQIVFVSYLRYLLLHFLLVTLTTYCKRILTNHLEDLTYHENIWLLLISIN